MEHREGHVLPWQTVLVAGLIILCTVVLTSLCAHTYATAREATVLSRAAILARSAGEAFLATSDDAALAEVLNGSVTEEGVRVVYDDAGVLDIHGDYAVCIQITARQAAVGEMRLATITVAVRQETVYTLQVEAFWRANDA